MKYQEQKTLRKWWRRYMTNFNKNAKPIIWVPVIVVILQCQSLRAEIVQDDHWRLSGSGSIIDLQDPKDIEKHNKRMEYYRACPSYIVIDKELTKQEAFTLLLDSPEKTIVTMGKVQGPTKKYGLLPAMIVYYLQDISREPEEKEIKRTSGSYFIDGINGYRLDSAQGRIENYLWRKTASTSYGSRKHKRITVAIGFTDGGKWDFQDKLFEAVDPGMGFEGCEITKKNGQYVLMFPRTVVQRAMNWSEGITWFSGENWNIRVEIRSESGYPDELVDAYLKRYPSVLTGNEKTDDKTRLLALFVAAERSAEKYMEGPDELFNNRESEKYHAAIVSMINIQDGMAIVDYYDAQKALLKKTHVDDGKYDFDSYMKGLIELRKETLKKIKELKTKAEANKIKYYEEGHKFKFVQE